MDYAQVLAVFGERLFLLSPQIMSTAPSSDPLDNVKLIYLMADGNDNSDNKPNYISTYEPEVEVKRGYHVIETMIVDSNASARYDIPGEINKALNKCRKHRAAVAEFMIITQHSHPYWEFPFQDKRYGIESYLRGAPEDAQLPLLSDMKNFSITRYWKHTEYHYPYGPNDGRRRYEYETFADQWILWRMGACGDSYLPYEVLHSLDNSTLCTMTHAFVEAFRCVRCDCDVGGRLRALIEDVKQWIHEHPEELTTRDINNETPLEKFNWTYLEVDRFEGKPIFQDGRYIMMRDLLKGVDDY